MKKEIKLTPKQEQVLKGLLEIEQRNKGKKVTVSDIHCNMTAVTKIVAPNWFDRTFNKLEELGLVEKEDMDFIVPGGYRKGAVEKTYTYCLTIEGLEYLGLSIDDIPVIVDEVEPSVQEQLDTVIEEIRENLPTGYRCSIHNDKVIIADCNGYIVDTFEDIPEQDYRKPEIPFIQAAFEKLNLANKLQLKQLIIDTEKDQEHYLEVANERLPYGYKVNLVNGRYAVVDHTNTPVTRENIIFDNEKYSDIKTNNAYAFVRYANDDIAEIERLKNELHKLV